MVMVPSGYTGDTEGHLKKLREKSKAMLDEDKKKSAKKIKKKPTNKTRSKK